MDLTSDLFFLLFFARANLQTLVKYEVNCPLSKRRRIIEDTNIWNQSCEYIIYNCSIFSFRTHECTVHVYLDVVSSANNISVDTVLFIYLLIVTLSAFPLKNIQCSLHVRLNGWCFWYSIKDKKTEAYHMKKLYSSKHKTCEIINLEHLLWVL